MKRHNYEKYVHVRQTSFENKTSPLVSEGKPVLALHRQQGHLELTWNVRQHHHNEEEMKIEGEINSIWHGHAVQTRLGYVTK